MSAEDKLDIKYNFDRIEVILSTDIFEQHNYKHPLVLSAFIELVICLDDLMSKVSYYCKRLNFTDDILDTTELQERKKKQVYDITSLINFARNAVCHINEDNRIHGGVEIDDDRKKHRRGAGIFFNRKFGKEGMFDEMQSLYDDDQSFAIGEHLIYLNRHLVRSYNDAKTMLMASYPELSPFKHALKVAGMPVMDRKPNLVEKQYVIRRMVEDGPYQRILNKFEKGL